MTFVSEGDLPGPFEGLILLACAPGRATASFSPPKVGSLACGDLASDRHPSGVLAFLCWSPTNELESISKDESPSKGPILLVCFGSLPAPAFFMGL